MGLSSETALGPLDLTGHHQPFKVITCPPPSLSLHICTFYIFMQIPNLKENFNGKNLVVIVVFKRSTFYIDHP